MPIRTWIYIAFLMFIVRADMGKIRPFSTISICFEII